MGKTKRKIKRGRDITKLLRRNGCQVRNGKGSHVVGTLPNGDKITYYHGELSPGMRRQAIKILTAAGLLGFIFGGVLALLI